MLGLGVGYSTVRAKQKLSKSVQARPVEQFDHVKNLLPSLVDFRPGAQLQKAARIRRGDDLRVRGFGMDHFFGEQIERRSRLRDVVNSRRTATDVRKR